MGDLGACGKGPLRLGTGPEFCKFSLQEAALPWAEGGVGLQENRNSSEVVSSDTRQGRRLNLNLE